MPIKLLNINIEGFKDPKRDVNFRFSQEKITVIHGENGSGKTTLLKIIQAILNKNSEALLGENIKQITVQYLLNGTEKDLIITVNGGKVVWGRQIKDLSESTSILFGVHRGVIQESMSNDIMGHDTRYILSRLEEFYFRNRNRHFERDPMSDEIRYLINRSLHSTSPFEPSDNESFYKKNHVASDFIKINEIEKALVRQFRNGEKTTSDAIKNAFFNTVENGVEIESGKEEYTLPNNFLERFQNKKEFLLPILTKLDKTRLQKRLINLLEKGDENEILNSKIFRALLLNILEKAEEENLVLKSISKLIEAFNSHLYRSKKLVVDSDKARIIVGKQKDDSHTLDKLSSGERHLLSFLTLFLIIGEGRNFFLIDEPEISLNMRWQSKLLPLLSELSPESQIIVATHSPSISNRNSNYLSELV